ncbi:hypothetical protein B195_009345 [Pseudomonas sp. Lz4W]|uniref:MmcQ/YjbR family DNA-binding protein n=1 Tax=Pseudomonas sp. Lz4W TaxID=1206777 RepID=UPI0002BF7B90|nr:MmcQ/YjbR family DNA-binding protein [Pseudomonas sp. Lz4W]AUB75017.1 hypothetical protein B195_009345 [Pseudomonas sp. Lz4W]NNG60371.1 MmcQ/YjbR family DNA-binding protein [Pseudomonas sp. GC01]
MSSRKAVLSHVAKTFDIQPDYPWIKFPKYAVLRHPGSEKWFGIVMNVPKEKLGLAGEGEVDILDVKCDPDKAGSLRQMEGILPGYHMNKEHWISVVLDGSVATEHIHELIQDSYELTE